MLRPLLWLALAFSVAGCRPCNERCFAGWRVSLESEGPLADGQYDVEINPDAAPVLEGSCVISEQGSVAMCEGSLRATMSDGSDAYDTLRVEDFSSAVERATLEVFRNDELWNEARVELEEEPTEPCNPHCAWDSATVAL